MAKWTKVAAAVLAAVAVILLGYTIFTEETSEEVPSPGMGDRHVYSSTSLALIVLSSFMIAVAIMFILLREEYEPLPPSMKRYAPPPPPSDEVRQAAAREEARRETAPAPAPEEGMSAEERKRETYLILRLLTGDERIMFKAIADAGGEALQKDLIRSTKMSNAKVSRVLDRLEHKGVITKERHGSTNRIRVSFGND